MNRVSTSSIHLNTVSDITRVQANLAEAQRQLASGQRVNSFSDLKSNINRGQDIQVSINATVNYKNTNDIALSRMNVMASALDQMIDVASKLRDNLVIENSPGGSVFNLKAYAESSLDNIQSALSTQQAGRSLFAGSKTDQAAVGSKNIRNVTGDTVNADYFQGDSFIATMQASDTLTVEYGITAADPTFQNLIAAFHKSMDLDDSGATADQLQASSLLEDGLDGLVTLRAKLGLNIKAVQEANDQHSLIQTQLNTAYSDIVGNSQDALVTGSIEAGLMEATLNVTMQVFARVSRLSLTEFLR